MKIIKTTCIMFTSLLIIFIISGCQKDSVSPQQQEKTHNESVSSQQKKNENSSNQQSKTAETKNTKTPTSSKKTETTEKKTADISEKSSSSSSKSNDSKKQNTTSAKSNVTAKASSTSKTESKSTTNQNNNTNKANTNTTTKAPEPALSVTISVISSDLNKTILSPTKVTIHNGDTFLTATRSILKQKGIPISVRGSGASAYVEGIGDLYEFDNGALSGWIAEKNGVKLDRSAGVKTVKNGDIIRWIYTTDYTKGTN
ncbi:MAG: DUF4430 domain-containing protein [Heyndrickxia sp.]